MAVSPTQRTLKRLKDSGEYPLVQVVEHWNSFARIRQDLFGIIDILAIDHKGVVTALQVTSYSNVGARVKKITESPATPFIRNADWVILVEGWHKKNNRWISRIVDLS